MDKRYPDLALLAQPARRAICCLAVEGGGEKIEGLLNRKPFSRYAENGLTVLLYDEAQSEAWRAEIERILAESGLCAGLSGPFALAASARGCFPKARIALETGKAVDPGRALYDMGTYSEAALLRAARTALGVQGFRASDFGDAAIEALARLDEREDAQYIRSLRAYLSDGLNLRRAAERLGVHRNTLAYRMRRIEARFALDLSDMNTCFELLFSLWLKEGLGGRADDEPTAAFDRDAARAALWRYAERAGNAARTEERFPLALAAVAAGGLSDARRAELTLALSALPQKPVTAFDDETLFFALPPEEIGAFAEAARPLCEAARAGMAVSQTFALDRLSAQIRLCRFALLAAGTHTVFMREIGSTLFFTALERRVSLAPYLCEDVIRVMDEDATRGSALSRSLYAYLLNFMDLKKAAQQLGIHRNTLEYQVRKMNAVIGGQPDEQKRFMMMCTYKMLALPDAGVPEL